MSMDMRYYINLIEARSHPELNPKPLTLDVLKKYAEEHGNDLFVHFNQIEKIGIKVLKPNLPVGTPMGVFAMPISMAFDYGLSNAKRYNFKYANILKIKNSSNVLNLSTVDISTMQKLGQNAINFYKKKTKDKSEIQLPNTVAGCYRLITRLLVSYTTRRNRFDSSLINSFFRKHGYNAIYDNQRIINDNDHQIVFLTPSAYEVLETIPLRF